MDFADEWSNKHAADKRQAIKKFIANPKSQDQPDYLNIVEAPDNWGVYASNGPNFKYAIFGRDSIVLADDLLTTHKELAHDIILVLARLQGVATNNDSEEEPGKIHHEYRSIRYDGVQIPDYSLGILNNLQRLWGNEGSSEMVYYGGYDATPLYIRLVCKYSLLYGDSILQEKYEARDGQKHTIVESLTSALRWITNKLEESDLGLLEYKRINQHGIENQAWKDSRTSYLRRDGSMPNFDKGIASIEIQGYTYDALVYGAKLLTEDSEQSDYWHTLASNISEKVINLYWMDDLQFFAQALHYDDNGKHQQIDALTSNGALILNSRVFEGMRPADRNPYLEKIAKMICSKDFITDAGVRSRALRHESIPGFIDYHGSYTVWHKETNEIAKGFRAYGLDNVASKLEQRILNAVTHSAEFSEFNYVDSDSKVWYDKGEAIHYFSARSPGGNLPIPEPGQAWTISSVYRICLSDNLNKEFPVDEVELAALKAVPKISLA